MEQFDLIVIGGGINGTGVAADAALRGLTVALFEQEDLASFTSSKSSKLIHGGLRYLEEYDFPLVREALIERDILLHMAPHLIHPLSILMPRNDIIRNRAFIRMGLWLYDHLYWKESLPKSRVIRFEDSVDNPLKASYKMGYAYSDCTTDDARLVVANALQAAAHGAHILTRHEVISAVAEAGRWRVCVRQKKTGTTTIFSAKALLNVSGPWVTRVLEETLQINSAHRIRLVKGSHIVVPKLYAHDSAYILQNADQRVVFVMPWRRAFTLIGTTDVDYTGDPADATMSEAERDYLCETVNRYFKKGIQKTDLVWHYSGVRPLQSDDKTNPQRVTRDYTFDVNRVNHLPLISVFGGKLTTYRKLSQKAIDLLRPYFDSLPSSKTHNTPLPGGDISHFETFVNKARCDYPFLDPHHLKRLCLAYGTRLKLLLNGVRAQKDMGRCFGADLYEREVVFLIETEWAQTTEDILWRRTKMGLWLSANEVDMLAAWLYARNSVE